MKTLPETISWLRRLAVVSCPEITCKQAAEVAEMLAEYADENMQLTDEFNAMVDERDTAIKERDEFQKRLSDSGVKVLQLATERDDAQRQLTESRRLIEKAIKERDEHYENWNTAAGSANAVIEKLKAEVERLEARLTQALDAEYAANRGGG